MAQLEVLLLRIGFYLGIALTGVFTLRDVRINVPLAVVRGDDAILDCSYDLEGDQLYAVQWYLGIKQFYRYTPKEIPPIKQFGAQGGLFVRENASNATRVVIEHVPMNVSGRYSCEVSADAPSFSTYAQSASLQVVDLPKKDPTMTGLKTRYHMEDILKANCTSANSNPAANLTWYINGMAADRIHVHNYRHKDGQFHTAHSMLRLKITKQSFSKHRLKIRCVASMYDIYYKSNEKSVEIVTKRRHSHVHSEVTTTADTPLQWELAQAAETQPKTKLVFVAPIPSGASRLTKTATICILLVALWR